MARGSTLTLYKKYDVKMDDDTFNSIVNKYIIYNREHDYSSKKKSDNVYGKDIPIVMPLEPFKKESEYDEATQTWKDLRPLPTFENIKNSLIGFVDSSDKMYCERIMEWSFNSSFDCLVEEYNLGHYGFSGTEMKITSSMAESMLIAINYILNGDWSEKAERGMSNRFIKTFTDGYNCDSYWKYIHRNSKNKNKKVFRVNQDGYDITIKCPVQKSSDSYETFGRENLESDEIIEHNLDMFRNGLLSFLKSDNWNRPYNDEDGWMKDVFKYKYMLTYGFWG